MSRLRIVSFDMEGTLVDPSFSNYIWEIDIPRLYAEQRCVSIETAKGQINREYRKVGEERIEWYDVDYWFRKLELSGNWRELLDRRRNLCRSYPEARGVLERLKDRYVLIVTSNTIREFLEIQLGKFSGLVENAFSAPSDFQLIKSSADFWCRICAILGTIPEAITHVGDHQKFDYEVPRQLGIQAYYLDRSGEAEGEYIVQDLEDFEKRIVTL